MFDRIILSAFEKACHWMQTHLEGLDLFQFADLVRWPVVCSLVIWVVVACSLLEKSVPQLVHFYLSMSAFVMVLMIFHALVERRVNVLARSIAYDAATRGMRNPIELLIRQSRKTSIILTATLFLISWWGSDYAIPFMFPATAHLFLIYLCSGYIQSVTPLTPNQVQRARQERGTRHMTPATVRD